MKISKIFYMSVAIGLNFGVAVMMLAYGLLGHTNMTDAFIAFFVLSVIGAWMLGTLLHRLLPSWKLLIVSWLPKNAIVKVEPPE